LHPGIAYGTAYDGPPGLSDLWLSGSPGATPQLATDLGLAEGGLTTKLGHLLAPTGVRYLVIPNHDGPTGSGGSAVQVPGGLLGGLGLQTDLQVLGVGDPNYTVYENAAWAPARAVLPADAAVVAAANTEQGRRQEQQLDLSGALPVLTGGSATSTQGTVPAGSLVYIASTRSSRWQLRAGGSTIAPTPAFGWGMGFKVPGPAGQVSDLSSLSSARLTYTASPWSRVVQLAEVVLWGGALALVALDGRRRRTGRHGMETVDPEWFVPLAPAATRARSPRLDHGPTYNDLTGDEVWTDV
jgi:hypothetical protein